jgi:hypothetical protein
MAKISYFNAIGSLMYTMFGPDQPSTLRLVSVVSRYHSNLEAPVLCQAVKRIF